MDALVWLSSWQQQCCGEAFQVGSSVRWTVQRQDAGDEWAARILGPEWGRRIRFREEHHDDEVDGVISGTVSAIKVVTCDRVFGVDPQWPDEGQLMLPVNGSGRLRAVQIADPWEPEPSAADAGWSFDGWVVQLTQSTFDETGD